MLHDEISDIDPAGSKVNQTRYTLPLLLDQVCYHQPNSQSFQQWVRDRWHPLSHQAFQLASEESALGLLGLKLERGDCVSLFMHSNVNFCIADMACLLAGLVDVPIDIGFNSAAIQLILQQTASKAVICSDLELLVQLAPCLRHTDGIHTVILAEAAPGWSEKLPQLPTTIQVISIEQLRAKGRLRWSELIRQELYAAITPESLATIVYTAAPDGQPRGVMLSHASLAGNILAAFATFPTLQRGTSEVALLFLPLTHVFARAFFYGHLEYGHQIYFTTPSRVTKHLRSVQPTVFITVPRFLEKAYERILENGNQLSGLRRLMFQWALRLAQRYDVAQSPRGFYALELRLANRLVFSHWRAAFGGRIKYLICGGAALQAELVNLFAAAGIPIFQGYGLTESSSVLCCNRESINQAGTVGLPIAGVEIQIDEDGEILAKTPYVMQGYYQDSAATQTAIDAEGWLHTGDLGEFTPDGLLRITGYKKNLFKLSIGKYISPQPIEQALKQSPLVKQAIVVGAQQKFCALLIFPDLDYLCPQAEGMCFELEVDALLKHPKIIAHYQTLIDAVNQQLPHWSTIKRFRLLHLTLTLEAGQASPALTFTRDQIAQLFASEIEEMYREEPVRNKRSVQRDGQTSPPAEGEPAVSRKRWLAPAASLRARVLHPLHTRLTRLQTGGSPDHV